MTKRLAYLFVVMLFLGTAGAVATSPAHAVDKDCSDFDTQKQAQNFFLNNGGPNNDPHQLDADGDGVACETLPCPCSTDQGGGGSGGGGGNNEPDPIVKQRAKVLYIIDGDTVKVKLASGGKKSVRMVGINTPERGDCGYKTATAGLKEKISRGDRVLLISDRRQPLLDRYQRLLRYVEFRGVDINRAQIKRGWAKVMVVGDGFTRVKPYRKSQRQANRADRGNWSYCK